jgi:hypothetical protein
MTRHCYEPCFASAAKRAACSARTVRAHAPRARGRDVARKRVERAGLCILRAFCMRFDLDSLMGIAGGCRLGCGVVIPQVREVDGNTRIYVEPHVWFT